MKIKVSKKAKVVTLSGIFALLCLAIALSAIGIYFSKHKSIVNPENVNPVEWSIDKWDGKTQNADNFLSGEQFANRGEKAFTINSAESFIHFVNLTQDETLAEQYNFFKDYTIYLNTSIDLANKSIDQIGKKMSNGQSTFQGIFDGGYYTIYNAKLNGGLFAYTTNATIKNIGLYNPTITSTKTYTGGILDEGIDTTIADTYVRAGSIKGNNVAGIVGKLTLTKPSSLTNSFADTTFKADTKAGLINEITANPTAETAPYMSYDITHCYFTNAETATLYSALTIDNSTILANPTQTNFTNWDYAPNYTKTKQWCNFSGINTGLEFNLPILTKFNKTFVNGSYYENVLVKDNGEIENLESLSTAFNSLSNGDTAQVNLIVEQITVDEPAVLTANATLTLNTAVNTTLTRGTTNTSAIIASGNNSKLTVGDNNSTATITIDGNKDYITANNLKSASAIIAAGDDFSLCSNVTIKNNINNTDGFGGGVLIYNVTAGQIYDEETNTQSMLNLSGTITNCQADNGGGMAVVGCASNLNPHISYCIANEGGGGLFISDNLEEEKDVNNTFHALGFKKVSLYERVEYKTGDATISGTYSDNSANFGGGVYVTIGSNASSTRTVTLNGCLIYNNKINGYGGGLYMGQSISSSTPSSVIHKFNITPNTTNKIYSNTADDYGGGIYITGNIDAQIEGNIEITDNKTTTNLGDGVGLYFRALNLTLGDGVLIARNTGTDSMSEGGGVFNSAQESFKMEGNVRIINNYAGTGGGIFTYTASNVEIKFISGYIESNEAIKGAGMYFNSNYATTIDIESGMHINKNISTSAGGGIFFYNEISANITGCEMKSNTAINGGAIFFGSDGGTLTLTDPEIKLNKATSNGGGIYKQTYQYWSRPTIIFNGYERISDNTADSGRGNNTYGYHEDSCILYYQDTSETFYTNFLDTYKSPKVSVLGYTFYGCATSSSSTETITPKTGTKTTTTDESESYYAVFYKANATRTDSSSVSIYLYVNTTYRYSRNSTKTTTYTGIKQYYNYKLSVLSTDSSGETVSSVSYSSITAPDNSSTEDKDYPTGISSPFAIYGWNTSPDTKASSTVTVKGGTSFTPTQEIYYAVWVNTSYYEVTSTYNVKFYYNGSSNYIPISQEQRKTGTAYANYLGSIDSKSLGSESWADIAAPSTVSSRPSGVSSSYNVYGWNSSSSTSASSSVTVKAGVSFNPKTKGVSSYYAVYYYHANASSPTRAITFKYGDGSGQSLTENQPGSTTAKDTYKNYAGTTGTDTGGVTTYSGSVTAPSVSAEQAGDYVFKGWVADSAKNSQNASTVYAANASFTPSQTTYYATWQKDTAAYSTDWTNSSTKTINYNWGTGSGNINSATMQIQRKDSYTAKTEYFNYNKSSSSTTSTGGALTSTYQGSITLPTANANTTVGYNLVKWHLGSSSGTDYALGAEYKITANNTDTVTFFAEFSVKTYSVAGTGGTKGSVTASKTTGIAYTDAITISWSNAGEQGNNYTFVNVIIYAGTSTSGTVLDTITTGTSKSWNMSALDPAKYAEQIYIYVTYNSSFITYNINIKLAGGGEDYSKTGTYGTAVEIATPSRTGYTFAGWTASGINTTTAKYGTNSNPTTTWDGKAVKATYFLNLSVTQGDTVTLTATWTKNNYTITLVYNNGSENGSVSAQFDTDVTIANPSKTGYTFMGWTSSGLYSGATAGGTAWTGGATTATVFKNLTEKINGSVTLTATWQVKKVNYTAAANNGTITPTSGSVDFNGDVKFTYDNSHKTGYHYSAPTLTVYAGTSSSGDKLAEVNNGSSYTFNYEALNKGYTEDVYIYVTYTETANSYSITLSLAGGQCATNSPVSATFDADVTIANPTRTGYDFDGWTASGLYSGATAGGEAWTGEIASKATVFKNLTADEDGSVTLTATWKVKTYNIHTGGNNGTVEAKSSAVYTEDVSFSWESGAATGYVFTFQKVEIYASSTNSGAVIFTYNGAETSSSFNMSNNALSNNAYYGDICIYVTYLKTPINYTIVENFGYAGQDNASIPAVFDTPAEVTNPTRTGYRFTGFTATIETETAEYGARENTLESWNGELTTSTAAGTSSWFKNLCINEGDSITITANWEVLSYTIKFRTEHGNITGITDGQQVEYNQEVTIGYSNAGKTGYKYPNAAVLKIYKQEESDANLLQTNNGGTELKFNLSTFKDKDNNIGNYYEIIYITLHYDEVAIQYKIDYTLDNGNFVGEAVKQATYDQAFEIQQPTRKGYAFAGWTADVGETAQAGSLQSNLQTWDGSENVGGWFMNLTTEEDATVMLTANWTALTYAIHTNGVEGTVSADVGATGTFDSPIKITFASNVEKGYSFTFDSLKIYAGDSASHSTELQSFEEQPNPATWTMALEYYPSIYIEVVYTKAYSNRTLTANANGGTISETAGWLVSGETATKSLTYGDPYGTLPEVTKAGYVFDGWFTEKDAGDKVTDENTITEDTTIFAHWRLDITDSKSFSITYDKSIAYTGSAITPKDLHLKITYNNSTVLTDDDYIVKESSNNTDVTDNASITIEGQGEYGAEYTLTFSITPKDINSEDITIDPLEQEFVYTGTSFEPTLTITDTTRSVVLQQGEDKEYTLSYANNKDASTDDIKATITITGKGNYGQTRQFTFEIKPRDITTAEIELDNSTFVYTGKAQKPKVTVKLAGVTIDPSDYVVSYETNSQIGINEDRIIGVDTYTVIITGTNNATGTNRTAHFEIIPLDLSGEDVQVVVSPEDKTFIYNRSEQKPTITNITIGSYTLSLDSDIASSIYIKTDEGKGSTTQPIDAGSYYLVISSNGKNYIIGEYQVEFTIKPASLTGASLVLDESTSEFDNTDKNITISSLTTNKENNSLELIYNAIQDSSEYYIEFTRTLGDNADKRNVGEITVTAIACNKNFEGRISTTYTITPADISKVEKPKIANVVYNRKQQTPTFTLKYMGFTLVENVDYSAKYVNNTDAGTATIEITALDKYVESAQRYGNFTKKEADLTLSFTIDKATIDALELTQTEGNYNQEAHQIGIKQVKANSTTEAETLTLDPSEYAVEYYRYKGEAVDSEQTTDLTSAGKIVVKVVPNKENKNFDGSITAEYEIKKVEVTQVELNSYIFTYNTKPQHPTSIKVTSNSLTLNSDEYTVAYYRDGKLITAYDPDGENLDYVNAGTIELRITLTAKGQANYTLAEELTKSYVIDPKNITNEDVEIHYYYVNGEGQYVDNAGRILEGGAKEELNSVQVYVGQLVRPELKFVSGEETLEDLKLGDIENQKDYTYQIANKNEPDKTDNFSHVGNYTLTTTGHNNYTGTIKIDYQVNPAALSAEGVEVTLNPEQYTYTGKPIEIYTLANPEEPTAEEIAAINEKIHITYDQTAGEGAGKITLSYGTDYKFFTGWFDYSLGEDGQPVGKVDENSNETTIKIENGYYANSNINVGPTYVYLEGLKDYFGVISVPFEIVAADISQQDLQIDYTKEYTYNGFEQKPVPTIQWQGSTLENGKNYSYTYRNNTNATTEGNLAYIHVHCEDKNITFIDFDLPFTIKPHDINDSENIAVNGNKNFEYNTKAQVPTLTLVYTSTPTEEQMEEPEAKPFTLTGQDYDLTYKFNGDPIDASAIKNAGTYTIEIAGKGNYTGTRTVQFEITQKVVANAQLQELSSVFNNKSKFESIVLTLTDANGESITEGLENFTVRYLRNGETTDDFTNAGEITIEISNLEGSNYKLEKTISLTYTIEQLDLNDAGLNVTIEDREYTGEKFEPKADEFTLKYGDYTLVENTDFTIVSYGENTTKTDTNGTAYILIQGKNNFKNTYTIYFKIVGVNLGKDEYADRIQIDGTNKNDYTAKEFTYDAKDHKYAPQITFDGTLLVEGQDLSYTYYRADAITTDFKTAGKIKIKVEGINNYSASFELEYTILQKDISETTVNSAVKPNYTYTSEALYLANSELNAESLTVKYSANGEEVTLTLTKGKDYTVKYLNEDSSIEIGSIMEAGSYSIVVSGTSNFTGEYTITFVVDKLTIQATEDGLPENFEVEITEMTYNTTPFDMSNNITVKYKSQEVSKEHYTIATEPNIVLDARTYNLTITFNEQSNFEGALKTTFAVKQADISAATGFEELFEGDKSNYTYSYTGKNVLEEIKQNIYMFETTKLVYNSDFTVSTSDEGFTGVGHYTISIVGKGNYTGELEIAFKITQLEVNEETEQNFECFIPDYTYEEGVEHNVQDELRVEFNGEVVDKSQYTVTVVPEDVTNAGQYDVTVKFKDGSNFKGEITTQFTVAKKTLSFTVGLTERAYFEQERLADILANDVIISGDYNKETLASIGTITFDAVEEDGEAKLAVGEQKINWTFIPNDDNYAKKTGVLQIDAKKIEIVSVQIQKDGEIIQKLSFTAYDDFAYSNLSLLITRNNGSSDEISFEELSSNNEFAYTITLTDGKVTVATNGLSVVYTEKGVTKSCSIVVEIRAIELAITGEGLEDIVEGIDKDTLSKDFELSTVVNAYASRLSYLLGEFKFYKEEVEQEEITSGDYVARFVFDNPNFTITEEENRITFYVKSKTLYSDNNVLYAYSEKGFNKGMRLQIQILTGKDKQIDAIRENNGLNNIEYVYVIFFVDANGETCSPAGEFKIYFNRASFSQFRSFRIIQDEDVERMDEMTNMAGEYVEVFANAVGMIVLCSVPNNMAGGIRWIIFFIILLILLLIFLIFILNRIRTKHKRQKMVDELNQENIGKRKKAKA